MPQLDYRQAAHGLLRDTLLDAAGEMLEDSPWSEISMAAIATRAGVSRQTLYNEFGSRDAFAQRFALRAADRFLTDVEQTFVDNADDPHRAMEAGFLRFLELAETDPMVRHIVVRDPGADELLALFTSRGGPVVELGTSRLTERMVATWPQADPAHARVLAEGLVRMAISHAGLPNADIRESTRRTVELLDPFIDRYLVI